MPKLAFTLIESIKLLSLDTSKQGQYLSAAHCILTLKTVKRSSHYHTKQKSLKLQARGSCRLSSPEVSLNIGVPVRGGFPLVLWLDKW